ncbi:hypothetical protein FDB55_17585 [Clostridium botulinum]|uniref:hypothetical protein n=1 Tax=Clostridium botulinum TaxID=1491 RepID=UPI000772E595|nr:hypothetical protein [Clostridium botulinum]NFE13309.1 hypothetical protein [Clostridium botulinum]NFG39438.1 hypothetical protein [Clostridium botulinum]NFL43676.1 hypothetical protein [Clostridium botulinum]NFN14904.1 hypothetical protein [Clostridium botulinum]NFN23473.1 hypothetical protein [Clostridium botulinum]
MVQEYAIKVGNKFFKDFIYYENVNNTGRYSGHWNGEIYKKGDIVDLALTKEAELTLTKRSLAGKIQLIYDIDKFKKKKVSIIPVNEE